MSLQEVKNFYTFNEDIKELYCTMSIPSTIHSYSLGVEYIKQWFLNKFNKDYFKTIHIDGKHVLDDFRKFDSTNSLKTLKPSISITPQLQFEYDRNKIDSYPFGIKTYIKRSNLERSFFKDIDKNLYMGITLEQMQVNFNFRAKVSTRAQQVDLYKFMQMACRVGYTQGEYVDMDIHIPYSIILQLAKDAGYKIENEKIVNIIDFVSYLNTHSQFPILFKLRAINGNTEFFMRLTDLYVHINCPDQMSADDGERQGMISDNFMVELNVELQLPSPKLFIYYSIEEHDTIEKIETASQGLGMFGIKIPKIPEKNDKGWDVFLTTEYFEEDINNTISIDFKQLFDESTEIGRLIKHNKSMMISSSIFLDFKLYNNGEEMKYEMDWESLILTTIDKPVHKITNIIIYTDLKYINNEMLNIEELYKDRLR